MKARPHPVHFAGAAWWVAFVVLAATLLIRHNDLSVAAEWDVVGGGLLAAIAGLVGPAWRWWRTSIVLEGSRLRWESGVWRPTVVEIDLARAREVAPNESWPGRLLGYATTQVVDEGGVAYVLPPLGMETVRALEACKYERPGGRRGRRDG